ncbi:RNA-binding protein [Phaeovulum vinaykumarii]|uniref:YlxR domain-containing protein n=1 Tax=Phaeovulum vinaykumarii TaxID=407234 RepID=A0A1N7K895_9RHOB|nr:RNA-binding protein [Phaeovulum vinaykumarii]SIS57810.1 hypothetical protein SAMN05421795_101701 [Phaeovulum vinaykumarii]SOB93570.1 hypothetical protein SAMN05878426_101698 [Phaeovulum vinaykumarii]
MTRGGADRTRDEVQRRCIVTGEVQPRTGLVRFVISPEGVVVPDLAEKLPGRGIWVAADRAVLEKAVSKNAFARAARAQVSLPDDLVGLVEAGLAARVVELVSLARKSGAAVCGFEKVKDWLAGGRAKILLQAHDGSDRGKGKLFTPPGGRWFGCLSAQELGLAFGRDRAIHGALAGGGLGTGVIREATRLSGLRGLDGSRTAGKDKKTA